VNRNEIISAGKDKFFARGKTKYQNVTSTVASMTNHAMRLSMTGPQCVDAYLPNGAVTLSKRKNVAMPKPIQMKSNDEYSE